jgi:hypothetical protein
VNQRVEQLRTIPPGGFHFPAHGRDESRDSSGLCGTRAILGNKNGKMRRECGRQLAEKWLEAMRIPVRGDDEKGTAHGVWGSGTITPAHAPAARRIVISGNRATVSACPP